MTVTTPNLAHYKRAVVAQMRRWKQAEGRAEEERKKRDEVIREALAAGVPQREIVELTGFVQQRVSQINRDSRL